MRFNLKEVLVTARTVHRFGEPFNALSRSLSERLEKEGYSVRAVGPGLSYGWERALRPWAVIFSGGDDLGTDLRRDKFERELMGLSIEQGIPIIGICRGAQLINTSLNGTLFQSNAHINTVSRVSSVDRSFEVTCYHAYEISCLGDGLEEIFLDEGGRIEGFQDSSRTRIGIMWHPERESPDGPAWAWFAETLRSL